MPGTQAQVIQPHQVVLMLVGLAAVVAGAYFMIYFFSTRSVMMQRGRVIRVYDRVQISRDAAVCLIEAAGSFLLVGITPHSVTLLETVDSKRIEEAQAAAPGLFEGFVPLAAADGNLADKLRDIIRKNQPESSSVATVREEDDLDSVYRRMQARRSRQEPRSAADFDSLLHSEEE